MIIYKSLLGLGQNMKVSLNSQKTPHISPYRTSYEVSFVMILEKNFRVIMTLHCNFDSYVFSTLVGTVSIQKLDISSIRHVWNRPNFPMGYVCYSQPLINRNFLGFVDVRDWIEMYVIDYQTSHLTYTAWGVIPRYGSNEWDTASHSDVIHHLIPRKIHEILMLYINRPILTITSWFI